MPRTTRPPEPRLAWAYVSEARAAEAGVPLPELGAGLGRLLPEGSAEAEPHRLAPVTAWAHLRPRARPQGYCPVCLAPVTLKLGHRLRHHYAHAPESACAAATAEGALHLAAKLRLAEALSAGGSELELERLCHRVPGEVAGERCAPAAPERWGVEWDEVRVERALPSLRADLLLLHGGAPVLALEVCATHAVDAEKAEKYRSLGLPWVEVSARRVAPDAGPGWSAGAPLPVLGDSRLYPEVRRCPRHEALYAAYEEHRRNGVHPLAWRVVHLYRTDAGRTAGLARTTALVVWMLERREAGEIAEAWLQRDGREVPLSRPVEVRDRERAKRILHRAFLQWARWTERARGAVVDSPMSWADGAPPPPRERPRLFPERLRMNPQSGTFEGVPGLPPLAWPLPLLETAVPHPVLGHAPLCWTDLPTRDLGPLLHAVVGSCWLTLRPHEWIHDGERCARADLSLHHHDGRRWSELRDAALSHSFSLPPSAPSPDWTELLLAVARLAADDAAALASGRAALAGIARSVLP